LSRQAPSAAHNHKAAPSAGGDMTRSQSWTLFAGREAVSGAVTNASYTVTYSGGATATVTNDQTQHAGPWVKLRTWTL
jgi:hypothetical protein